MKTAVWITIAFLVTSSSFATPPQATPSLLPDLVERIMPGVVNISSITVVRRTVYGMDDFLQFWGIPQEHKQTSLGSGFIIDREGYVLTNNHVVQQATEVIATLADKRQFRAKLVGRDSKLDLALLQIRDKDRKVPTNLTPVALGDSEAVRIAETVIAVGNPFGLQGTVTAGIISAKNRTIGVGPFDNFLQTDASINPGNSGGPLFNLKGEVIGINTVIYSKTGQSGGLGFAIPSNEARDLIPDFKKYGRVPRPWLGVRVQPVTPQIQEYLGLPVDEGVLVVNLDPSGPAGRGGIRAGDIIVRMKGAATPDSGAIERALAKLHPKDQVELTIQRGRRKFTVELRLAELPIHDDVPQGVI